MWKPCALHFLEPDVNFLLVLQEAEAAADRAAARKAALEQKVADEQRAAAAAAVVGRMAEAEEAERAADGAQPRHQPAQRVMFSDIQPAGDGADGGSGKYPMAVDSPAQSRRQSADAPAHAADAHAAHPYAALSPFSAVQNPADAASWQPPTPPRGQEPPATPRQEEIQSAPLTAASLAQQQRQQPPPSPRGRYAGSDAGSNSSRLSFGLVGAAARRMREGFCRLSMDGGAIAAEMQGGMSWRAHCLALKPRRPDSVRCRAACRMLNAHPILRSGCLSHKSSQMQQGLHQCLLATACTAFCTDEINQCPSVCATVADYQRGLLLQRQQPLQTSSSSVTSGFPTARA